jgi:hypothetical protein
MKEVEFYNESIRLNELISEYRNSNDFESLEETILQLIEVYDSLNYLGKDEYLEEIIKLYKELRDLYIINKKAEELVETYRLLIEYYSYVIRDDMDLNLKKIYIKELKDTYKILKKIYVKANIKDDIKDVFVNIKEYL